MNTHLLPRTSTFPPMPLIERRKTPRRTRPTAGNPVLMGADRYAGALQTAGGRLVDTRLHQRDPSAVGVALYASPPYNLEVPALPVSRLSIVLTPSRVSGCLDGDRPQTFQSSRYALFLAPAGASARWHKESPSRHLTLYFNAESLNDGGDGQASLPSNDAPLFNLNMPGIRPVVDELLTEIEVGAHWSAEASDSLGRLLLIKVARQRAQHRAATANPLTPQLLERLAAYVRANLGERILVNDLAAVVGLPPNRFAQAYVACTGQSPHQLVMTLRLQQAQALLQSDQTPLAEVAAACGFASQQHLTHSMRQRLGITPARYRRERAGGRGTAAHGVA